MTEPLTRSNPQAASDAALLDRLSELRDVELPDPASVWPPAPGWWALMLLLGLAIWLLVRFLRARRRRLEYRKDALETLLAARARWEADGDALAYASSADQLVRRVAIHLLGRESIARLTGAAFTERVNELSREALSEPVATLLRDTRYRSSAEFDLERVHREVEAWIRSLAEPRRA